MVNITEIMGNKQNGYVLLLILLILSMPSFSVTGFYGGLGYLFVNFVVGLLLSLLIPKKIKPTALHTVHWALVFGIAYALLDKVASFFKG
jgi:hypothetical protein